MRIRPFILVSTIGRTPPMLGSLLLGHFAETRNYAGIAVLALITVIILAGCVIKRKQLAAFLDSLEQADEEMRA